MVRMIWQLFMTRFKIGILIEILEFLFFLHIFFVLAKMDIKPQKIDIEIPHEERQKQEKKPRPKSKTAQIKTSTFFVTINTNIYLNDKSEQEVKDIKRRFIDTLTDFLPSFDNCVNMSTSKAGVQYGYSLEDPREVVIKRILEHKLDYVIEVSPSGRLHAHIMFYLKKRAVDTKLNLPKIKEEINRRMNINCYVHYKLHPSAMTLENYMRKNPITD